MFSLGSVATPLALLLLGAPVFMAAALFGKRRGAPWDIVTTIAPQIFWFLLSMTGLKASSLSNLAVELPVVSLGVVLVLAARLFGHRRLGPRTGLALALGVAALAYALIPALPE